MKNSSIRVCQRCVMDTTAKEITFDDNGVSNFSKHYDNVEKLEVFSNQAGQEKLDLLIEEIKKKGKNKKYDVLIGLSGGVDSSYVAYLLKKKYEIRPLAIHLDNGWNTELSVANISAVLLDPPNPALALGDILGSNMVNMLIFGSVALIFQLEEDILMVLQKI